MVTPVLCVTLALFYSHLVNVTGLSKVTVTLLLSKGSVGVISQFCFLLLRMRSGRVRGAFGAFDGGRQWSGAGDGVRELRVIAVD